MSDAGPNANRRLSAELVAQTPLIREALRRQEEQNLEATLRLLVDHERALLLLAQNIIAALSGYEAKRDRGYHGMANLLLLARSREDLLGSWTELARGRYGCANSLLRGAYECWVALQYLAKNPQTAEGWAKADPTDRSYDFTSMKKSLVSTGVLSSAEANAYSILSCMTHPSAPSTFPYLFQATDGRRTGPFVNEVRLFDPSIAEHLAKCAILIGLRIVRFMFTLPGTTGEGSQFGDLEKAKRVTDEIRTHFGLDDSLLLLDPRTLYKVKIS